MVSGKKRRRDSDAGGVSLRTGTTVPSTTDIQITETEPSKKRVQQRRTLFIRALPATATTENLIEHFSESFPIKHATAVIDPSTKQCKGYGFITFADAEDAQKAAQDFQDSTFQGRKIKLEIAEPRHRDVEEGVTGEKAKSKPAAASVAAKAKRDEQQQSQIQPPPRLIIRNLPWSIKKPEQLIKLFLSYGKIKNAVVPQTKPGLQAGFGFVTIRGKKNAENALKGVNGLEVDGRTLAVDWAVNKDTWQAQNPDADLQEDAELVNGTANDGGIDQEIDDADEYDDEADHDEDSDANSIDEDSVSSSVEEGDQQQRDGHQETPKENYSSTLFIRNLPFTSTDESLQENFEQFGAVRYARIVVDPVTERPRGTGFVCFYKTEEAEACLKAAPRHFTGAEDDKTKKSSAPAAARSILQSEEADPSGQYTLDGRILQVTRAVDRSEAARLTEVGATRRNHRDNDKRRLYLLSEGTISSGSKLFSLLSNAEVAMREQSAKQRKTMVQNNPSLNLSLTRLSIRNIPRSVTSKDLKQLAREAVVGFAIDVKAGKRERISKEELARGGEDMVGAEKERKEKGKGLVKQAKVVFEGREGSKVQEESGAGRSRGYGFVEYYTHRAALMGLRWLNGHAVDYKVTESEKGKSSRGPALEKNKRLVVEFAIENAQVVHRRFEREKSIRDPAKSKGLKFGKQSQDTLPEQGEEDAKPRSKKSRQETTAKPTTIEEKKLAARSRIIAKKRAQRRDRRKAGS